jgi:hypothetical protein
MKLSTLCQRSSWDLLAPLRGRPWPDSTVSHVLAHLLAAPVMFGAVWLLVWVWQRDPLWGMALAVVYAQIGWQWLLEETHSTVGMRLPLWSMLRDVGTTAAGAALTVLLIRWLA